MRRVRTKYLKSVNPADARHAYGFRFLRHGAPMWLDRSLHKSAPIGGPGSIGPWCRSTDVGACFVEYPDVKGPLGSRAAADEATAALGF